MLHRPQLTEPPDADPHVRWCGRGVAGESRLPPIPIAGLTYATGQSSFPVERSGEAELGFSGESELVGVLPVDWLDPRGEKISQPSNFFRVSSEILEIGTGALHVVGEAQLRPPEVSVLVATRPERCIRRHTDDRLALASTR